MTRPRPFAQVDVFSPRPFGGNPVAVILDGEGLSPDQMQAIARWTNLSETTFVVTPTTPDADYRVRIFTPGGELPFAGHPTLGTAHAWLENGGTPRAAGTIVQECTAGLVPIRRDGDTLSFAAPPTIRSGPLDQDHLDQIVAALGISAQDVVDHQWIDNGPGWCVVRLASAQEVLDLAPDFSELPAAMVGALGAYPPGSAADYELRAFAPGVGVPEDPVCGSMNASVGQWLARAGEAGTGYRVSQGSKLGRSGDITVTVDAEGIVWVGGATTSLFMGLATA